jgi:hypothetical protein
MAWTHYASTDASAPAISGTVDALNLVLKACLVDGYGAQPAAGWTSPFYDATSKTRVFQNANGFCLQVADGGPGAGDAREARIRGYESMSAFNAGAGPFPTVAQFANGEFIRKSATAAATARAWDLYANETLFILLVETGDTALNAMCAMFGRFKPDKMGDAWCQIIAARTTENLTSGSPETVHARAAHVSATTSGIYLARDVTGSQATGSVVGGLRADPGLAYATVAGSGGIAYPDPATGGLRLERTYVHELNIPRGFIPGLWTPLHNRALAHRATEIYADGSVARTLRAHNTVTVGQLLLEDSDTVDL